MLVSDIAVKASDERIGPRINPTPPLLAVEVISPTETRKEVRAKAEFYITHGVGMTWAVWPKKRIVDVYTMDRRSSRSQSSR